MRHLFPAHETLGCFVSKIFCPFSVPIFVSFRKCARGKLLMLLALLHGLVVVWDGFFFLSHWSVNLSFSACCAFMHSSTSGKRCMHGATEENKHFWCVVLISEVTLILYTMHLAKQSSYLAISCSFNTLNNALQHFVVSPY